MSTKHIFTHFRGHIMSAVFLVGYFIHDPVKVPRGSLCCVVPRENYFYHTSSITRLTLLAINFC